GGQKTVAERPGVRTDQPNADVTAQPKEDDAAEIDIAGIAEHHIEIARKRYIECRQDQALAKLDIVAEDWRRHEDRDRGHDEPEERLAQHHSAPRLDAKTPSGNAISTATNSVNSITSVQLTGTKGATSPSSNPSTTPPIRAPWDCRDRQGPSPRRP